jgi:meso-butanediol dehydrogenase/(S,S)-butanediol dehydrogenase/diacetyl reductase
MGSRLEGRVVVAGLDEPAGRTGDAGLDPMASSILPGRPAQPEDIGPTAQFLACPYSDHITGQIIPVEGGMVLV